MDYVKIYTDFLKKFFKPRRKLKVVFDCSNGTTGIILKKLFQIPNSRFIILNSRPDGNFPAHGPNPLAKGATKQLEKEVKKQRADLGVIFDADGDRAFFVDDRGNFLDGDQATRLLIEELRPKKTVIDPSTGWLIKKHPVPGLKNKIIVSRVGTYFIKEAMKKHKADFAAERSGHYYFKNFFNSDSGILAAVQMINKVSKLKINLSDYLAKFPKYYRESIDVRLEDNKMKEKILKTIRKKYQKSAKNLSALDGITLEFDWGWLNVRPSNTEPLLRLNIETSDKKVLDKELQNLKKLITI